MKRAGQLPRDALHAMTALEIGLDAIITTDADFAQVEELAIYTFIPCQFSGVGRHSRL
jgi:predicted nucleic acid-binding protein